MNSDDKNVNKLGQLKVIHNINPSGHLDEHMKKQIDSKLPLKIIDLSYLCSMQDAVILGTLIFCTSQKLESQTLNKSYYVRIMIVREQQDNMQRNVDIEQVQMGKFSQNRRRYKILYEDKNQIGSKGMKYLSSMHSPVLK